MDRLEGLLSMIDHILNTKRKRHLAGGMLMSASLLFGGLALTIITLKDDDDESETTYIE